MFASIKTHRYAYSSLLEFAKLMLTLVLSKVEKLAKTSNQATLDVRVPEELASLPISWLLSRDVTIARPHDDGQRVVSSGSRGSTTATSDPGYVAIACCSGPTPVRYLNLLRRTSIRIAFESNLALFPLVAAGCTAYCLVQHTSQRQD